jgi:hypothetical protein
VNDNHALSDADFEYVQYGMTLANVDPRMLGRFYGDRMGYHSTFCYSCHAPSEGARLQMKAAMNSTSVRAAKTIAEMADFFLGVAAGKIASRGLIAAEEIAVGEMAAGRTCLATAPKTATAAAPGARVTIQGVSATELPRRLSTAEMAALQKAHGTEFTQIYLTGPGKNGAGGTYYLIQGTPGSVSVPTGSNVRWINHTHPELHPSGAPVSLQPSAADRNVLQQLENAGSPQRTSQIVPEVGQPFRFKK